MAEFPAPLLSEQPRRNQILAVLVAPAVLGAITGVLLGISEGAYIAIGIVAAVGGVFAGFDHPGPGSGAKRGVVGGFLFGAFVLIAHAITGADAKTETSDPEILFPIITAIIGTLLGVFGGWLRRRYESKRA
jgi:hypothetical protein